VDSPVLQIVVFRDASPAGTEVFLPGEYTIGSDEGCELVLADARVAPSHARLSFRDGRIRLSVLGGGPGGMLVNGQPLGDGEVRSRDDVAVGPFLLKFRVTASKQPAAPAEARPAGPAPIPLAAPARGTSAALAPVPIARQPTPSPAARPAPVAALPWVDRLPSAERPESDYSVTTYVPVPASLLQAASKNAELPHEAAPAPAAAPAAAAPAAPAESPRPRQRMAVQAAPAPAPVESSRAPQRPAPAPPPSLEDPRSEPFAKAGALPAVPSLRVRVFWGRAMVGIHGFPFGRSVVAAAREEADLPLYGVPLPKKQFPFARVEKGKWAVRIPPGLTAYRFESGGWRPAAGVPDGDDQASLLSLDSNEVVRMGDARHSIEVRVDRVPALPKASMRESVDPQLGIPLGVFSALAIAAMIAMPQFKRDQPDFTPKRLAPVRALLKPPEKKKPPEEKKADEKKEEKKEEKLAKVEKAPDAPKQKKAVKQAMKAVEKTASAVQAVESLLKATTKLTGGPKGYGEKGLGYKVSPLIGKPPIVQAGIGFGLGAGGFGAETKGIGSMRGMGSGGGGIGSFAAGSVGKGKVAGAVISAPVRKAEVRGQLDRELIAKVINEHMGEIRGCYERALLKEAGLAGKLVLEWTIEPTGVVSDIRVKNATLRGPEVPNCIVGSVKSWAFPKPKGGNVVVSYPFLFNSVGF
jgi:hypothetical protein